MQVTDKSMTISKIYELTDERANERTNLRTRERANRI